MALEDIRAEKVQVDEIPPPVRGRGRPPGSGNKSSKKPPLAAVPPPEPEIPPEVVAAMLDSSLKSLVQVPCIVMDVPALDEKESQMMVEGCKPLINKYLPNILGEWAPEIMFLAMVGLCYGQRFIAYRERQRAGHFNHRQAGPGQNPSGEGNNPQN